MKKIITALAVVSIGACGALVPTGSASAHANCASANYACLYFNSDFAGSNFAHSGNISDYAGYLFSGGNGNGSGVVVKNNAASVKNNDADYKFTVHYNSGFQGPMQSFGPGKGGNLNSTLKNNNASGHFGT